MKKYKVLLFSFLLFILSGCTATYDLKISEKGFSENLKINATSISENNEVVNYPLLAYVTDNEGDDSSLSEEDKFKKIKGIDYYNDSISQDDNGFNIIKYSYQFDKSRFLDSSIINRSFSRVIIKKYDSNGDGKDDYTYLTTSDDFSLFDDYNNLEKVTIRITCNYKVISNNADSREDNTYIWTFSRGDMESINLIYDTSSKIDDRNLFEKNSMFVTFVIIVIIFSLVYLLVKKISKKKNEV